ncbi:MAG: hypothetical protein Q7R81_05485 [Candidatus Peregrinibacteria bacterium]|nr:hypothetical protein [Candidatus Peregrinibacteria bacterium]
MKKIARLFDVQNVWVPLLFIGVMVCVGFGLKRDYAAYLFGVGTMVLLKAGAVGYHYVTRKPEKPAAKTGSEPVRLQKAPAVVPSAEAAGHKPADSHATVHGHAAEHD